MKQPTCLAEHIAGFTGRVARFREKKFLKSLRKRKTVDREPDNNKPAPLESGSNRVSKP
jgi:hypothetical protein